MHKLLNLTRLTWHQRQRYNSRHVHIWAINMHIKLELLANSFNVLEAFLEVGTGTTDPEIHFVLDNCWGKFSESADHALEC